MGPPSWSRVGAITPIIPTIRPVTWRAGATIDAEPHTVRWLRQCQQVQQGFLGFQPRAPCLDRRPSLALRHIQQPPRLPAYDQASGPYPKDEQPHARLLPHPAVTSGHP